MDVWNRVGRRHEIAEPDLTNVIVPTHDYQTGARIVSLAAVREHESSCRCSATSASSSCSPRSTPYPVLSGLVGWDELFASALEIVGEDEGVRLLREILHKEEDDGAPDERRTSLKSFLADVETRGFVPMRLHFAVTRYRRWTALSADSTPQARARTLQEFWDTYGLARVARNYPETRARFFLDTVFKGAPAPLVTGLEEIVLRCGNARSTAIR